VKRVIICAVLLAVAISLSCYSYYKVTEVEKGIQERMEAFTQPLSEKDKETLGMRADELESYWDQQESRLIHFVRHSHLDVITTGVARLPELARGGEFGEFSAEVANIKRQIEHIIDNERLTFTNLV